MKTINGKEFEKILTDNGDYITGTTKISFIDCNECFVDEVVLKGFYYKISEQDLIDLGYNIKYSLEIYEVETNDSGYDTWGGFVVISTCKEEVKKMINERTYGKCNISKIKRIGTPTKNNQSKRIVLADFRCG